MTLDDSYSFEAPQDPEEGLVPAGAPPASADVPETGSLQWSAEQKAKVLRERALKLARKTEEVGYEKETLKLIEFMLAHERYAVEVQYVREVYPLKDLTPVPCTPSFVLGIINVRGQVVSVMDLKDLLDLPKKEITDLFRVLIIQNQDMELGILADEVLGEQRISVDEIHSGLAVAGRIRADYVKGVTKDRLIVLDADKLLSDPTVIVHHEVGD